MSDMARHVVNGRYCLRAACEKIQEVSCGDVAGAPVADQVQLHASPFAGSLKKIEETICSIIKVSRKSPPAQIVTDL